MKTRRCTILIGLIFFSFFGYNQTLFEKHYDVYYSQNFSNIICKPNGNLILTGNCFPGPAERRPWILETDSLGNVLWEKTIFENHLFEIHSSTLIENVGYLLCGVQFPIDIFDPDTFYLYKTNLAGDSLWSKAYFIGDASKAIELSNDTSIVVGRNYDKACALKINSNGDIIGTSIYDEINWPLSDANSIIRLSDTLFLVTGTIGFGENYNLYYVFIDENLNKKWSVIFTDYANIEGIETIYNNGFLYTLCQTYDESSSHQFIKTDSLGNLIWSRDIYFGEECWPTSMVKYDDNSFYITGYKYQNQGGGALLKKIDASANEMWQKNFGNQNASAFYSINKSIDDMLIIAGQDMPSAYLIKSDTSGSTVNTKEITFNLPRINLYPNPFSDRLIVESIGNKIDEIYLYDTLGKLIEVCTLNNANLTTLNIHNNYKGIIILKIKFNNGFQGNYKMLKL